MNTSINVEVINTRINMLTPLHDYLLIDPILPPKMVGELVVFSQEMSKPVLGVVLAKGPGKYNEQGKLVPISSAITVGCTVGFLPGSLVGKLWRDETGTKRAAFMLQAGQALGVGRP